MLYRGLIYSLTNLSRLKCKGTKINYLYNRKQMNLKNIVLNTLLINWIIGIIATAIYFVLYFSSEEFDAKIVAVSIIFGVYGTIIYII